MAFNINHKNNNQTDNRKPYEEGIGMDAIEVILDILDNLIVDKAFNKKISIKRRWPYIFIYYTVIILLLFLTIFFSIGYIKLKNIIGYFLILLSIILFVLLILPLFVYRNK